MDKYKFLIVCLLFPSILLGQKRKKEQYTAQDIPGISIDGEIEDWSKYLNNTESELWSFAVAINDNKLRAVVLLKNQQLIDEAIRNGILLNISYTNKQKEGAQLIFPRMNLEKLESVYEEKADDQYFTNEELIKSAKGYYVYGFSKVINGLLSFTNTYGIQAICKIDKNGHLIYEAEVPLNLINFKTKNIAVQLAVNTRYHQLKKLASNKSSSYSGAYGYRRMPMPTSTLKNPYDEPTEVWIMGLVN